MKRIHTYIFGELIPPFGISLFFLTAVFLMTRIPQITNMVVNYNADVGAIAMMICFSLPRFMEFTIPMSAMISILLTFMRMGGENEIVALKGAGVSLYRLLSPVLIFSVGCTLLAMWVTVYGVSWGKLSLKEKQIEMARSSIDAALQERQFNSQLQDIMIYVAHVDMKTKFLTDVFIEDRRTPGVVTISTAPQGRLVKKAGGEIYTIRLYRGAINQVNSGDNSVTHIKFGNYDINIDLAAMEQGRSKSLEKDLDELSLKELLAKIRGGIKGRTERDKASMQLHEKFAVPFACLTLGLLAFPLGVQSTSLRKSSGFGLGIFFFLLYYFLLALGWSGGEAGFYPPVIGMWMPNVVMGGAGMFLLVRNVREKPVRPPRFVHAFFSRIKALVMKRTLP